MSLRIKVSLALSFSVMLCFGICVTSAHADQLSDTTPIQQQEEKPSEQSEPSTPQLELHPPKEEVASLNCPTIMVAPDAIPPLKGLKKIEVLKTKSGKWKIRHDRKYIYLQKDGQKIAFTKRLKKVPDLRTQAEIHPWWNRRREQILFWGPIIDFGTSQGIKAVQTGVFMEAVN